MGLRCYLLMTHDPRQVFHYVLVKSELPEVEADVLVVGALGTHAVAFVDWLSGRTTRASDTFDRGGNVVDAEHGYDPWARRATDEPGHRCSLRHVPAVGRTAGLEVQPQDGAVERARPTGIWELEGHVRQVAVARTGRGRSRRRLRQLVQRKRKPLIVHTR